MKKHRVLITGVGGKSVGYQILYCMKGLEEQYDVFVADCKPFTYGLYLGYSAIILPHANNSKYLDEIISAVQQHKIDAIIPGTEIELRILADYEEKLIALGCHLIANPRTVIKLCDDKLKIAIWLLQNGFSTPLTVPINEWRSLVTKNGYPVIAKPSKETGGSRGVRIICNDQEMEEYLIAANDDSILQEYIDASLGEYTVGVVVSPLGEIVDSIIVRRELVDISFGASKDFINRKIITSSGISQGFIVKNERIAKRCEALALAIGARGPLNIQCRVTHDDISVFEIHPRFSGTTSIRATAGFNEVDLVLRMFLDNEVFGRIQYKTNQAVIRCLDHVMVPGELYLGTMPSE